MSEPLATYTIQFFGPDPHLESFALWLRETEENLNDLLPEGYHVEIKEWDAPEGFEISGMHWTREREL